MEELEIRALLEGAYALTPTLPGNYLRYDEFRTCFNKLVEKRNNVPLDVEKLLESYYPKAKYVNPEKPDVPLNKNDAFQKVQKRRVQEKR